MQKKNRIKVHICAVLLPALLTMVSGCGGSSEPQFLNLGFEAVKNLEYEAALLQFEEAAAAGEDQAQAARGKGIALVALTRYEEAVEEFLKAFQYSDFRVDEFDFDTNYYLATAYYRLGLWDEAEGVYTAILDLSPQKEAHYLRGVVRLQKGELKKAEEDFDAAIKLEPHDYDLRIDVFLSLSERGYKEEGKVYLQAALGNNEGLSEYNRGRLSYYLEEYENARNYLETMQGEKDSDTILLLGQTYEKLGDYNYAASIYSNYLADNSQDVTILNRLGMCRLQSGDAQAALECFREALELGDPSMTQVLKFNEIVAYEYLGEFDQANVLMRSYLASYPDDQDALREYEFLRSR